METDNAIFLAEQRVARVYMPVWDKVGDRIIGASLHVSPALYRAIRDTGTPRVLSVAGGALMLETLVGPVAVYEDRELADDRHRVCLEF